MDLEIREALALSENRTAALAQLLPGSEDHDFYRCLHAQHAGALEDADEILRAWPERHGHTHRYEQLRMRQQLYRVIAVPASAADEIRDRFGVGHWHEAEVEDTDPSRPTRLADGAFDGDTLLQQAIDYDTNLSQVTDDGLHELLGRSLDAARRRVLLSRLHHTARPELVPLIAEELATRGSGGFGSLAIHNQLTTAQLLELATLRPELRAHIGWVTAVAQRMRPHASIDLELDRDARAAALRELWRFVGGLPPAVNSLKAHVLWHLLDSERQRTAGPLNPGLVRAYLELPRTASYLARKWIERHKSEEVAQLGQDFRQATGLPPAGSDEELVRDLLQRRIDDAESYAQYLDRAWLDVEIATATLLAGGSGGDKATLALGPARAAALRDRIELAWCAHNPRSFPADAPIALDVDLKNVGELVVKVFRIDPVAYFQLARREVNTDLDLDGLAASHEQVVKIAEPPVRRVRRTIELPQCTRPGTYVIDLIGNGMSSRVVVEKGRLRFAMRLGAAGQVVTIVDDTGAPRPDARAWIGDREYAPDARGAFAVAFSTAPQRTPMLLVCGDIASVHHIELARETYQLAMNLIVDREALAAGRTVKAIARVALTVAGVPASLSLVKRPTWDVTLTDRSGVSTTKSQPLELDDDHAAVLEWPMGEDTAMVGLAIRGAVEVRSTQREEQLYDARSFPVATIHQGTAIEALYLANTAAGYVVSALGKTGEPRAQRPVTVSLVHRWARTQLNVELATDARGRVELGELPGVESIAVTLGSLTQRWPVGDLHGAYALAAPSGRDVIVPLPAARTAVEVVRRMSLVEIRHGVPVRHVEARGDAVEGGLVFRLPAGDYELRAPGVHATMSTTAGAEIGTNVVAPTEVLDAPRAVPVVAALAAGDGLRVQLLGATPKTRVHVVATRFHSALIELALPPPRPPMRRHDRARGAMYVSGRELGDEYRYVLERKSHKRHPGLLLDKPSLLLNPWSRRTTTTDVAVAKGGEVHSRYSMAAPAPGFGGLAGRVGGELANDEAFASHDFLPQPTIVLANLAPDGDGVVLVPRDALAGATHVAVVVADPAGSTLRRARLAETALEPRDLRLKLALQPERHATQKKTITPLAPSERLIIEDLATAKVHLIDSVERAHAYLLALRDDATLREFAFVTRWHAIADGERRELYSKYACHELHLFLYWKDRAFFDAVVAPYLAHKRIKTFVDHWLLGADLAAYLEPARLQQLSAFERALLAQRLPETDHIARVLGDQVAILPPDPTTDTRLIDALLGASALDADSSIEEHARAATVAAESVADMPAMAPPPATRTLMTAVPAAKPAAGYAGPREEGEESERSGVAGQRRGRAPSKKMAKEKAADKADRLSALGGDDDDLAADLDLLEEQKPHYRAVDKTQEWAENNWWHRPPAESGPDLITPNRLWRDLARHRAGSFLSPWLGLATDSFAEAMCALAVTDLPFVAGKHAIVADGPRLTITAAANALAGSSQIVDGELVAGGSPLVVGTSYVRTDDRYEWESGEQRDKYVDAFATGVVYTCQVVLANPTSSRQRIAALVQIPRGSMPVEGARATQTIDVVLEAYGTHGHEYAFYFPSPGHWTHFPVHVSRGDVIVAAAAGKPVLDVGSGAGAADPKSWAYVSQRGSVADVVAYLETANIAAIDTTKVAWRMKDRAGYEAILAVLEKRREYCGTLWAYALLHRDGPRIRTWLRALGPQLLAAGPALDMIDLDAEALGGYEHLELAPLINARAHRLGSKLRILNDGLAAQYGRFLDLVAHRRAPTTEDLLAATMYLTTQDRVDDAFAMLRRIRADGIADRMQHDYLAAYLACIAGDVGRARELAVRWREHPVDRWRFKFTALANMLDELTAGAAPSAVDPRSREQQHAELAARQPAFELALDRDGIAITSQHIARLELRFFEMDIELLFSRQPFVQSDISRFSFIEPGHRIALGELPPEHRLAWPEKLRGKNVVVEAVGHGQRKAKVFYSNDLVPNLANQVGQVRVARASDHSALPATYVKVYARKRGGAVAFYKDGYTDLRGWFDYASLSTTDLDAVERFAILVCSDSAGAAILEANPPVR